MYVMFKRKPCFKGIETENLLEDDIGIRSNVSPVSKGLRRLKALFVISARQFKRKPCFKGIETDHPVECPPPCLVQA